MQTNGKVLALIVAKIVCCGVLVLAATGALSGIAAWLFDGGLASLALAIVALGAGVAFWWQRQRGRGKGVEARPTEG